MSKGLRVIVDHLEISKGVVVRLGFSVRVSNMELLKEVGRSKFNG